MNQMLRGDLTGFSRCDLITRYLVLHDSSLSRLHLTWLIGVIVHLFAPTSRDFKSYVVEGFLMH